MFSAFRQTELCVLESRLIRFVEPVQFWVLGREICFCRKAQRKEHIACIPFLTVAAAFSMPCVHS